MGSAQVNQALILLEKCEKLDGYVSACENSEPNRIARRDCQYFPWNDQSLAERCKKMAPLTKRDVEVVIMTPSAEGGMPHTRAPNVICLPAYWSEKLLEETLQHELVHISQRQNPLEWKRRMAGEGWTPVPEFQLPQEWVTRCRINPDTYDSRFWAWQGRYVPLPIFEREDKPELREIAVRWWDGQTDRLNNAPPDSFVKKYGNLGVSQMEHPYELYAYDKHN
jgi:hypothetical protein